jgi:O-antigen/teichoic acid export membrane protein
VSGVKWNSVAMGANVVLHFGTLAVLARLLEPGDFGLKGMAVVITGFAAAFADAGISNAIIHRRDVTTRQLSALYWLSVVIGIALFIVILLVTPLVVAFYDDPRLAAVVRWSAVSFLIGPFGHQFAVLLRREMRFKHLSLIAICKTAACNVATIALALGGYGVMSLVWGGLIGASLASAVLLVVAMRYKWLPLCAFRLQDIRSFLSFGFFQMGERCVNYLAANVDYIIIGHVLGAGPLGYYTLAYQLVNVPRVCINPLLTSVAFPSFSRIQDDDVRLRRAYAKIIRYLSVATFPIMAGLFVVAPLLVPMVYGSQWAPAVPVVEILCLLGVLMSLSNPLGSILLAKGRADLGFYMNLFAFSGYAISNVLGARWGITGVAVSSLAFLSIGMMPVVFLAHWLLVRLTVGEWLIPLRQAAIASLVMLFVLIPVRSSLAYCVGDAGQLLALSIAGVVVYVAMILLLDRSLLSEAVGHLRQASA